MAVTPTVAQTNAQTALNELLSAYGLDALKAWAWDQITTGRSVEEIIPLLYQTPEFKARFPAMEARRKAGLEPISAADYVAYEGAARQAMRMAGLPTGFWDKPSDFSKLIANDISIDELNSRITNGYQRVAQAPQAVRDAYRRYFGVSGDAALASQFLDPTKANAILEHNVRSAVFGGTGAEHGWAIDPFQADTWADRSLTDAEVQAGFGRADTLKPLTLDTVTESEDLTSEDAFGAGFGTTDDSVVFQKRLDARKALNSGSGSANVEDKGVTGLGASVP